MHPRKRIKILFVSHASGLCGSERCLLGLLKGLNKDKYEPLVLMPENGPLKNKLDELGIKTIIYPIKRWVDYSSEYSKSYFKKVFVGLPKRIRFLCKLIEQEAIDLVYSNSIIVIDDAIAAKIKRRPHIRHIHNLLYDNWSLKPYLPIPLISILVHMLSSKIILVSNAVRKSYDFEKISKYNGKVRVVYNGVDVEELDINNSTNEKKDLHAELKLERGIKIIALVGRYQAEKGVREFVEAAKIVRRYFQNFIFVLIGHRYKGTFNKLKALAKNLELEDKIYFLDFREDIFPIYQSIDILVSASWFESGPLNIIEAMVAGKPVVATRCGGPEEIVVDGQTGFLVPTKSPEDLADAIMKLLYNPELAKQMGNLGQKRATQLFNLERYVWNVENIIDEVAREEIARFNVIELKDILFDSLKILIKKTRERLINNLGSTFSGR